MVFLPVVFAGYFQCMAARSPAGQYQFTAPIAANNGVDKILDGRAEAQTVEVEQRGNRIADKRIVAAMEVADDGGDGSGIVEPFIFRQRKQLLQEGPSPRMAVRERGNRLAVRVDIHRWQTIGVGLLQLRLKSVVRARQVGALCGVHVLRQDRFTLLPIEAQHAARPVFKEEPYLRQKRQVGVGEEARCAPAAPAFSPRRRAAAPSSASRP